MTFSSVWSRLSSHLSRPSGTRVGLPNHECDNNGRGTSPLPGTHPPFSQAPTRPLYPGGEPERGRKERYTPLSLLKVGYPVWSHRRYLAGALISVWHQPARLGTGLEFHLCLSVCPRSGASFKTRSPYQAHLVQWPLDHLLLPLAFRLPFGWSTRKVFSPACCGV